MSGISLVIDTNLLLLFVVGATDRKYVEKHRRVKQFSLEDSDRLKKLIESSSEVLVTPNTLTETSNLLRQIGEPARTEVCQTFRSMLLSSPEDYLESRVACKANEFLRLGLTDSVLLEVSDKSRIILTADLGLYLSALQRGLEAVNFRHLP